MNPIFKILYAFLPLAAATQLFAQVASPTLPEQGAKGEQSAWQRWHHNLFERLDLTDDQKEKVKQIRDADRENLATAWAEVKIASESLKAALLANPENTADVQAKAAELAKALSTSTAQTALHLAKINQVLKPEQRVTFTEAIENQMRRWHRPGFEQRGRPWRERGRRWKGNQSPEQRPAPPQESPTPENQSNP